MLSKKNESPTLTSSLASLNKLDRDVTEASDPCHKGVA